MEDNYDQFAEYVVRAWNGQAWLERSQKCSGEAWPITAYSALARESSRWFGCRAGDRSPLH